MIRPVLATLVTFAFAGLSAAALAQGAPTPPVGPDYSKIEVKTTDLGHRTYMLEGVGGNVTVAIGKDAIIMVDGQFAPMHDKLKAAIAALTPLPVKYLVNTHHHGDHTGGNAAFAKDGATVVGNINERNLLAAGTTNNVSGAKVPAVPLEGLPKQTYDEKTTLKVKGVTARLTHPHNAHTGGDTYVWFKKANVISTGDTFTNTGRYPNIDWVNGGSIDGMIKADAAYLRLANDKTKIVPGHGELSTRADVKALRAMLIEARKRMVALIKAGKSEDEIFAAKPFADFDATWASGNEQVAKNFIKVVYHSLKK